MHYDNNYIFVTLPSQATPHAKQQMRRFQQRHVTLHGACDRMQLVIRQCDDNDDDNGSVLTGNTGLRVY